MPIVIFGKTSHKHFFKRMNSVCAESGVYWPWKGKGDGGCRAKARQLLEALPVGRLSSSSPQASGRNTAAEPTETEPKRIIEKSTLKVDFRS